MLKHKLAFASLLVLTGCGASREALMALDHMNIVENSTQPGLSYRSISGSGNDITLNDVELKVDPFVVAMMTGPVEGEGALDSLEPGAAPAAIARAQSMSFKGLTMKDGKPIFRDIRLNAIAPAIPLPDAQMSLATMGLEGMNEATGTFIAGAFAMDPANTPPPAEAWAFTRADIGGLKVAGVIPQDEGEPGSFNVELGEISVNDFTAARIGQTRFAGLKGTVDIPGMPAIAGTFDFGTMTASEINAGFIAKSVMAGWEAGLNPDAPVDYAEIYRDLTSPLDGGVDRLDWTGMTANFSGLKFDTSEMHMNLTRNADGVVTGYSFPRFNAKMTADASSGTLGAMGMMALAMAGYESNAIDVYMGADATFDPAKDLTRWTNYNVGVSDLFDVKISGGVIGLKQALPSLMNGFMAAMDMAQARIENTEVEPEEDAEPPVAVAPPADGGDDSDDAASEESEDGDAVPPEADEEESSPFGGASPEMMMSLMMGILPLQLTDLDIAITDTKLVGLVLNGQAIEAGQTLEAYRTDLATMVAASAAFLTDAGVDAAIASEISSAASGFMSGPGTLRIQLKPKTPLGVMTAMALPMTKENLGFSASFTPAAPPEPPTN